MTRQFSASIYIDAMYRIAYSTIRGKKTIYRMHKTLNHKKELVDLYSLKNN